MRPRLAACWPHAGREYRHALQLQSNHVTALHRYGELLALLGVSRRGIALLERARRIDPVSLIIGSDLAKAYFFARRYREAIGAGRDVLELDFSFTRARLYVGLAHLLSGDPAPGLAEITKVAQLDHSTCACGVLAHAKAASGNHVAARALLNQLQERSVWECRCRLVWEWKCRLHTGHWNERSP